MTFPIRVADGRLEIGLQYEQQEFDEGLEIVAVIVSIKVPDTEGMEYNRHDVAYVNNGIEVWFEATRKLDKEEMR